MRSGRRRRDRPPHAVIPVASDYVGQLACKPASLIPRSANNANTRAMTKRLNIQVCKCYPALSLRAITPMPPDKTPPLSAPFLGSGLLHQKYHRNGRCKQNQRTFYFASAGEKCRISRPAAASYRSPDSFRRSGRRGVPGRRACRRRPEGDVCDRRRRRCRFLR